MGRQRKDPTTPESRASQASTKRGPITSVACEACRKRKSKCDGARPVCSICRGKDKTACLYSPEINGSRTEHLRQQNQALKEEILILRRKLNSISETGSGTSCIKEETVQSAGPSDACVRAFEAEESKDLSRLAGQDPEIDASLEAKKRPQFEYPLHEIAPMPPPTSQCVSQQQSTFKGGGNSICLFGNLSIFSIAPSGLGSGIQQQQSRDFSLPIYLIQPLEKAHDETISTLYSHFRESTRLKLALGGSADRLLGSPELDAGVALSRSDYQSASELSRWTTQVISSLGGPLALAPKLGLMYLQFKLMRWQISPTFENFMAVPEIMRPTPSQLLIPHSPFIDFLIWPVLRDLLICEPWTCASIDYLNLLVTTPDLIEAFAPAKIVFIDPCDGQFRLLRTFEEYVVDVSHWSLAHEIGEMAPALKGKINFR